jgi:hypothetical protein
MITAKFQKMSKAEAAYRMNLVTAAEMAVTGLKEEEVVRQFGARCAEDAETPELLISESESWLAEAEAYVEEALQPVPVTGTLVEPVVWPDTPVERAYKSFVSAAAELCDQCARLGFEKPAGFIEAVINVLRVEHDSHHMKEAAASSVKSLTTVMDLCGRNWDNLENHGTEFGQQLELTTRAAGELRDALSLTYDCYDWRHHG